MRQKTREDLEALREKRRLHQMGQKTAEEIHLLKANWISDPCWDIETTEGFEEHAEELLRFRRNHELLLERREKEKVLEFIRLQEKSEELGVPGNIQLARVISDLEKRVEELECR